MEYTVHKLAELAGVSARTLRYYDQIGLLRPARIAENGYRIYGSREVDALQQILFYREMGMPLEQIAALLGDSGFDRLAALRGHRERLLEQRGRLDRLIANVQRTIAAEERGIPMNDNEKFEGFKRELIDRNEALYGAEIREIYSDAAVDAANAKLMNLTPEQYAEMQQVEADLLRLLDEAFATGDPTCKAACNAAEAHKRWLGYTWGEYTPEAHSGLVEMYVVDERFAAYYDRGVPGRAAFLRDAVHAWLGPDR